jgi:NNP family nitrate/nitrite transporter-like MFS transporter
MSAVDAGWLATAFTLTASLMRAAGGGMADRFGARRVVEWALVGVIGFLSLAAMPMEAWVVMALGVGAALAMGIGMAAALRFVPEQFPRTVGAVSGMIGAVGGLGGFLLPMAGVWVKGALGSPNLQLAPLAVLAAVALGVLVWESAPSMAQRQVKEA